MRPMVLCKLQSLAEARILTTARGALRRAHSGERQHGALRIPGSDSTALYRILPALPNPRFTAPQLQ